MSSFWLNAHDIRKYRALIISSMTAISVYVASAAISVNPANSPADAWQVILARAACSAVNPAFLAAIPRVKDTARYPRAIGIPLCIPFFQPVRCRSIHKVLHFYLLVENISFAKNI